MAWGSVDYSPTVLFKLTRVAVFFFFLIVVFVLIDMCNVYMYSAFLFAEKGYQIQADLPYIFAH